MIWHDWLGRSLVYSFVIYVLKYFAEETITTIPFPYAITRQNEENVARENETKGSTLCEAIPETARGGGREGFWRMLSSRMASFWTSAADREYLEEVVVDVDIDGK